MHQTNIHWKPRFRSVWVFRMLLLLIYNTKIRWVIILISSVSPKASSKHVDIYTTKRWWRYSQIFKSKFLTSAWYTIHWYKTVLCETPVNVRFWLLGISCIMCWRQNRMIQEMEEEGVGEPFLQDLTPWSKVYNTGTSDTDFKHIYSRC